MDSLQKIVLISLSTPTYNNVRAASALPYHLIRAQRGEGTAFVVYSFNINEIAPDEIKQIEASLGITIRLLPRPRWMFLMMRLRLLLLRVFLRYPLGSYYRLPSAAIQAVKAEKPDVVWIYGEEIAGLARWFSGMRCVVTMPDCESLFYYRLLGKTFATRNLFQILKSSFAYHQYLSLERHICLPHVRYHFVGQADASFFQSHAEQGETLFLRHPLYDYKGKPIAFHQPRIKLLIAGRNDFYMADEVQKVIALLTVRDAVAEVGAIKAHYDIAFLGKGWEPCVEALQYAGFAVSHQRFAEDYIEALQAHDIQLTPIAVGTGTKGKVLDAIANGLLVVGTLGALENIAVEHGKSCLLYHSPHELVTMLATIPQHVSDYERMAEAGREQVLAHHQCLSIVHKLFHWDISSAE